MAGCGPAPDSLTARPSRLARKPCKKRKEGATIGHPAVNTHPAQEGGRFLHCLLYTSTARRTFKTHWSEPAVPVIEVTNDGSLSCHVMAKNGTSAYMVEDSTLLGPMAYDDGELSMLGTITFEDGELVLGDAAKCVSFDVERIMPDGTSSKVAGGILDAQEAIDRIPPCLLYTSLRGPLRRGG